MSTVAETGKNVAAATGSGILSSILIPQDLPLMLAIVFGLVVGTIASWVWNDQSGIPLPKKWLIWQIGSWGLIFVLALYAQEQFGLSSRASMAMAAVFAWLGRDGLQRLRTRYLDAILKEKTDESQVRLPGADSAGPSSGSSSSE